MAAGPARNGKAGDGGVEAPSFVFAPYRLPGARYAAVFERGRALACGSMAMRWLPNGLGRTCLGVVTTKRALARAVDRSRARRLMREAFRLERPGLRVGFDVVLVARRRLVEGACRDARRDLRWLCRKAGLVAAGGGE